MDVIVDLVLDLNLFDCPSHEPDTERNADMIDRSYLRPYSYQGSGRCNYAKPVALIHTGLKSHPAQRSVEEKQ